MTLVRALVKSALLKECVKVSLELWPSAFHGLRFLCKSLNPERKRVYSWGSPMPMVLHTRVGVGESC